MTLSPLIEDFEVVRDQALPPGEEYVANMVVTFDHFIARVVREQGIDALREHGFIKVARLIEDGPE